MFPDYSLTHGISSDELSPGLILVIFFSFFLSFIWLGFKNTYSSQRTSLVFIAFLLSAPLISALNFIIFFFPHDFEFNLPLFF